MCFVFSEDLLCTNNTIICPRTGGMWLACRFAAHVCMHNAPNAIHVQCSAGHAPVYTSDHALMLCHAVHFTVYT